MKKLIAITLAGALLLLGCAHRENLTEEEKEEYRKSKRTYDASWGP